MNTLEGFSGLNWGTDSPWQGKWVPLAGKIEQQGHRWIFNIQQDHYKPRVKAKPSGQAPASDVAPWEQAKTSKETASNTLLAPTKGLRKIRWIIPHADKPVRVRRLTTKTDARWKTAELLLQLEKPAPGQKGQVEMYFGQIMNGDDGATNQISQSWDLGRPLKLKVRSMQPQPWMDGRSMMRIELPSGSFAVAVDDVITSGVYLADLGCLLTRNNAGLTPAEVARQASKQPTVLKRVEESPDQTYASALRALQIPSMKDCPGVTGLAADNNKVEVSREGEIHYDSIPDNPAYPDAKPLYPGLIISSRFGIAPRFGSGKLENLTRRLNEGWMPIPETIVEDSGIRYRQLTFVAPLDEDVPTTGAPYINRHPLGVAEYVMDNFGSQETSATLKLTFYADRSTTKSEQADLKALPDGTIMACRGEQLLACLDKKTIPSLTVSEQGGVVTLEGRIPARKSVHFFVYFPIWEAQAEEARALMGTDGAALLKRTQAYWRNLLAPTMQIEIPDTAVQNVINASQAYCLLATRNEAEGARLAPWIALYGYGPLESEAHAIIRGMEYLGHADYARRSLDFYLKRYKPEGFMTHGYTLIGTGQHLWTLADYFALSGDAAWMKRNAAQVKKACQWIVRQCEKTKRTDARGHRVPEYGLMPPGVTADMPAYTYCFFNNGLYYAGLRRAADELARLGDPDAAQLQREATEFREDILRAYHWMQGHAPALPLGNGNWTPACAGDLYGYEAGLYYGYGPSLSNWARRCLRRKGCWILRARKPVG